MYAHASLLQIALGATLYMTETLPGHYPDAKIFDGQFIARCGQHQSLTTVIVPDMVVGMD